MGFWQVDYQKILYHDAIKSEKLVQKIKYQRWMAWQVHSMRGYFSSVERYAEYPKRTSQTAGHQSAMDRFPTDC